MRMYAIKPHKIDAIFAMVHVCVNERAAAARAHHILLLCKTTREARSGLPLSSRVVIRRDDCWRLFKTVTASFKLGYGSCEDVIRAKRRRSHHELKRVITREYIASIGDPIVSINEDMLSQ